MVFQTHLQQVLAYLKQGNKVLPAQAPTAPELNAQTPPMQGAMAQAGKPIQIAQVGSKKIGGL